MMTSSKSSISLPPRQDTFLKVFTKHQLWPNLKPRFDSLSVAKKTAVIIGGNAGIGLECGRLLLSLNLSHLIIGARSVERGQQAATTLRKAYPSSKIDVWHVDMESYSSMLEFSKKCNTLTCLNIAIISAGIMNVGYKECVATGHEQTYQVNYLSTAFLSLLLLPSLSRTNSSGSSGRLTLVASGAALVAEFSERNESPILPSFDKKEGWDSSTAKKRYDMTKAMVLILQYELSKMVKSENVIVNVVDPTFTPGTGFFRELPLIMRALLWPLTRLLGTSVNNAAWRYIDAAVARGPESHGSFISDWEINPFHHFMYTEEGVKFMETLWDETLRELDFPEVHDILKSLKADSAA